MVNTAGHRVAATTLAHFLVQTNLRRSTPETYRKLREIVLKYELCHTTATDMELTRPEVEANDVIMRLKMDKYNMGIKDPYVFNPGFHIFERLKDIQKSPLFQLIRKMPKGGALKVNDTSICSTDFLIKLTYKENLWVYTIDDGKKEKMKKFRFLKGDKPKEEEPIDNAKWQSMEELRKRWGEETVREELYKSFSMFPLSDFHTNAEAWQHLIDIFSIVGSLLRSQSIWEEHFYNALKEFSDDGIQYMEIRSSLPRLFKMDGTRLPVQETLKVYQDQVQKFQADHSDFIGARVIYSPLRHVSPERMSSLVELCTQLNVSTGCTHIVQFSTVQYRVHSHFYALRTDSFAYFRKSFQTYSLDSIWWGGRNWVPH